MIGCLVGFEKGWGTPDSHSGSSVGPCLLPTEIDSNELVSVTGSGLTPIMDQHQVAWKLCLRTLP